MGSHRNDSEYARESAPVQEHLCATERTSQQLRTCGRRLEFGRCSQPSSPANSCRSKAVTFQTTTFGKPAPNLSPAHHHLQFAPVRTPDLQAQFSSPPKARRGCFGCLVQTVWQSAVVLLLGAVLLFVLPALSYHWP